MRTERRHELQTNELADWIAKNYVRVQPYLKTIAAIAIAGCVLVLGYSLLSGRARERDAAEWDKFFLGMSEWGGRGAASKQWNDLAKDHKAGTPLGDLSHLVMADANLGAALQLQVSRGKHADSLNQLRMAATAYDQVFQATRDPFLKQRALFGLAKTHEALNELKEARTRYQQIIDLKTGAFVEAAKERLADLNKPATKEFYDLLADASSQPASPLPDFRGLGPDFLMPQGPSGSDFPGSGIDRLPSGIDPKSTDKTDAGKDGGFKLLDPLMPLPDGPKDKSSPVPEPTGQTPAEPSPERNLPPLPPVPESSPAKDPGK